MKRLGVIGLGKMGRPIARNLLQAGFPLIVFDVATKPVEELVSAGVTRGASVRDVVGNSDVIVLSLPDPAALQAVVLGEQGLTSGSLDGKTIIDTSTVTLQAALEGARAVEERGGKMLDAPVTGGVWGAEQGKLAFFVGGDEPTFEQQRDVFAALGSPTLIGPPGHGQVGKMVCQMLGSVTYAVNAEALALCDNLGVDAAKVAKAFNGGQRLGKMVELRRSGEIGTEGYTAQRGKDIDCASRRRRNATPLSPLRAQCIRSSIWHGWRDWALPTQTRCSWCGTNCANRGLSVRLQLLLRPVFGTPGQPIIQGRHAFRMPVGARQKTCTMLRHRVLIGRLIAQVHAPAHMIGVVGSAHVNAAVVEQDGAAGFQW